MDRDRESFETKLSILDSALDSFAKNHQTQVESPDLITNPPVEFSTETRNIIWMDGPIAKGVVITPHQTPRDIKADAWDFCILAWIKDYPAWEKPFREFRILKNAGITTLSSKIEDLLRQADQILIDLKFEDLK
jgi:hypothetical protein